MTIDELNDNVQVILAEMTIIKEKHKAELAPFNDKIDSLNESFLDENLLDKNGETVSVGMTIMKNKIEYKVIRRYQQCLFHFLGNCRVVCTTEGKKKYVDIYSHHLNEFEIIK